MLKAHQWWLLKPFTRMWRDGSNVKSTSCSCRESMFTFQHPHGGSWSAVVLIPRYPVIPLTSSGIRHTHDAHTYNQAKTLIHIKLKNKY